MKKDLTRSIADIVADYVQESHLEDGLFRAKVFEAWDRVVEAELGPFFPTEQIPSLTISKYFVNGVLKCTMASSVVRSQLRARSSYLVTSINRILGEGCVNKIVLS